MFRLKPLDGKDVETPYKDIGRIIHALKGVAMLPEGKPYEYGWKLTLFHQCDLVIGQTIQRINSTVDVGFQHVAFILPEIAVALISVVANGDKY